MFWSKCCMPILFSKIWVDGFMERWTGTQWGNVFKAFSWTKPNSPCFFWPPLWEYPYTKETSDLYLVWVGFCVRVCGRLGDCDFLEDDRSVDKLLDGVVNVHDGEGEGEPHLGRLESTRVHNHHLTIVAWPTVATGKRIIIFRTQQCSFYFTILSFHSHTNKSPCIRFLPKVKHLTFREKEKNGSKVLQFQMKIFPLLAQLWTMLICQITTTFMLFWNYYMKFSLHYWNYWEN